MTEPHHGRLAATPLPAVTAHLPAAIVTVRLGPTIAAAAAVNTAVLQSGLAGAR